MMGILIAAATSPTAMLAMRKVARCGRVIEPMANPLPRWAVAARDGRNKAAVALANSGSAHSPPDGGGNQ
jgi:hypothetical protein